MTRYIDADILSDALRRLTLGETDVARATMKITHYVSRMPTDDVRKNVIAKKVIGGGEHDGATCWFECSHCHGAVDINDAYCKHCGAALEYEK